MQKLLFLSCFLLSINAIAQCSLSGHVYDGEKKENMTFVRVFILGLPSRIISAFTDTSGHYQIDSIPEGKFDVLFCDGARNYKDTVVSTVPFKKRLTTHLSINFPTFCEYKGASKTCPLCRRKDKVIPISYGDPTLEALKKAAKGKAFLGGCLITGCDPKWYCKRDKKKF